MRRERGALLLGVPWPGTGTAHEGNGEHGDEDGRGGEEPGQGVLAVRERRGQEQFGDLPVGIDQQRHPAGDRGEEGKHDREDHQIEEGEIERAIDRELVAADVGRSRRDLHAAGEEAD